MQRLREDTGAVMAEYAIMISFIAAVAFTAVQAFGISVTDLFQSALDVWP